MRRCVWSRNLVNEEALSRVVPQPHTKKLPCLAVICLLLLTYLLTYSMVQGPSWETGLQLVKKLPAFHRTRRFITALTSVRHLSLSWISPIQSTHPHPTSLRSILILSTHLSLGLPSGLFPPVSPPRPYTPPLLTRTRHMPSPSHSSRFYHPHNIGWGVQII